MSRAAKRGVQQVIAPGYDLSSWDDLGTLLGKRGIHTAFGLHPWVSNEPLDIGFLEDLLGRNNAVAVGEIGLDFKVTNVDTARQTTILKRQLDLAEKMDLSVILHCRGAFEELAAIIDGYSGKLRGVLHAFSRGPELATRFVDLGLHLAFGGSITRPGARRARRSAQVLPLDRIRLETDAPSSGLEGVEPEDVEPHHVRDIAEALAELRGISVEEVAAATTANATALFFGDRD